MGRQTNPADNYWAYNPNRRFDRWLCHAVELALLVLIIIVFLPFIKLCQMGVWLSEKKDSKET